MTEEQLKKLAEISASEMDKVTKDLGAVDTFICFIQTIEITKIVIKSPITTFPIMPKLLRILADSLDIIISENKK